MYKPAAIVAVVVSVAVVVAAAAVVAEFSGPDQDVRREKVVLDAEAVSVSSPVFNGLLSVDSPVRFNMFPTMASAKDGCIRFAPSVQFPAQGVDFRYLEMEWRIPDSISPSEYVGTSFHYGMSTDFKDEGPDHWSVRYELPRGDASSPHSHKFDDAFCFYLGESRDFDIVVTYRVCWEHGGATSECEKEYIYHVAVPGADDGDWAASASMQGFISGLSGSEARNVLKEWAVVRL